MDMIDFTSLSAQQIEATITLIYSLTCLLYVAAIYLVTKTVDIVYDIVDSIRYRHSASKVQEESSDG